MSSCFDWPPSWPSTTPTQTPRARFVFDGVLTASDPVAGGGFGESGGVGGDDGSAPDDTSTTEP